MSKGMRTEDEVRDSAKLVLVILDTRYKRTDFERYDTEYLSSM